jgi:hypothetical protein
MLACQLQRHVRQRLAMLGGRPPLLDRRLAEVAPRVAAHDAGAQLAGVRELAAVPRVVAGVAAVVVRDAALDPMLMVAAQSLRAHSQVVNHVRRCVTPKFSCVGTS